MVRSQKSGSSFCIVLSHGLVCTNALSIYELYRITLKGALILLIAKLNLMSGMVIGAAGVMVMKQMCKCKRRNKYQETHAPVATLD